MKDLYENNVKEIKDVFFCEKTSEHIKQNENSQKQREVKRKLLLYCKMCSIKKTVQQLVNIKFLLQTQKLNNRRNLHFHR